MSERPTGSAPIRLLCVSTAANTDDAVLAVVAKAFKETAAVRFEGNNYSDE